MGQGFSSFTAKKNTKLFIVGATGVGKTTILFKLKFGSVTCTVATGDEMGGNIDIEENDDCGKTVSFEEVTNKDLSIVVFDLPDNDSACADTLATAHFRHGF